MRGDRSGNLRHGDGWPAGGAQNDCAIFSCMHGWISTPCLAGDIHLERVRADGQRIWWYRKYAGNRGSGQRFAINAAARLRRCAHPNKG